MVVRIDSKFVMAVPPAPTTSMPGPGKACALAPVVLRLVLKACRPMTVAVLQLEPRFLLYAIFASSVPTRVLSLNTFRAPVTVCDVN